MSSLIKWIMKAVKNSLSLINDQTALLNLVN